MTPEALCWRSTSVGTWRGRAVDRPVTCRSTAVDRVQDRWARHGAFFWRRLATAWEEGRVSAPYQPSTREQRSPLDPCVPRFRALRLQHTHKTGVPTDRAPRGVVPAGCGKRGAPRARRQRGTQLRRIGNQLARARLALSCVRLRLCTRTTGAEAVALPWPWYQKSNVSE